MGVTGLSGPIARAWGSLGARDVAAGVRVRAGTYADYLGVARFHYLSHRPRAVTRVLVLEVDEADIMGRYRAMCGLEVERVLVRPRVIGVLVETLPTLACRLREEAFGGRYHGWGEPGVGARLLNAEVRRIARVVIDPRWRGLGLAVRLVREAIESMQTPCLEALAAMGRVNPMFERAGMVAYRRWPHERDQRLIDAIRFAGLEGWRLSDVGWMERWLGAVEGGGLSGEEACRRGVVRRELRRWAWRGATDRARLIRARDRLLREPVYYVAVRGDDVEVGGRA